MPLCLIHAGATHHQYKMSGYIIGIKRSIKHLTYRVVLIIDDPQVILSTYGQENNPGLGMKGYSHTPWKKASVNSINTMCLTRTSVMLFTFGLEYSLGRRVRNEVDYTSLILHEGLAFARWWIMWQCPVCACGCSAIFRGRDAKCTRETLQNWKKDRNVHKCRNLEVRVFQVSKMGMMINVGIGGIRIGCDVKCDTMTRTARIPGPVHRIKIYKRWIWKVLMDERMDW